MNRTRVLLSLLALVALPGVSHAQTDKTNVELGLYVWATGLYGDVETSEAQYDNNISFSDIWENLNGSVMAHSRFEFGDFSVVGDVMYADLETDREERTIRLGPRGNIRVNADAKLEARQWIADLSLGYRLFRLPDVKLAPTAELYAGARYWSFSSEVNANLGAQGFDVSTTETWVDPMIGARIALALSPTVDFVIQGDGGGFGIGNSSEFQWMQMTTLSWAFSESARIHLGYKFAQFRRDNGDVSLRQQFRGPLIATTFRF
jgi:hypothetical protein